MNKFPVCGQHETVPSLHGCLKPFQTRTEDIRIFPLRKVVDLKKKKNTRALHNNVAQYYELSLHSFTGRNFYVAIRLLAILHM